MIQGRKFSLLPSGCKPSVTVGGAQVRHCQVDTVPRRSVPADVCPSYGRYCNTCAFLMAPQLVPASAGTRAGGLMALVFQTASLAALGLAFAIIAWQP